MQSIAGLDLSAFEMAEVPHNQGVLRFRQALVLTPSLDEERQQWMVLEEPELNIHVAQTREALREELQKHISMLWDEYAVDAESNLSPAALVLRARLQAAIEEVPAFGGCRTVQGRAFSVFRVDPRQGVEIESRHGTQECVRHLCFNNLRRDGWPDIAVLWG